jgi:hypothetical protein
MCRTAGFNDLDGLVLGATENSGPGASAPLRLEKVDPATGAAVRVTTVPAL